MTNDFSGDFDARRIGWWTRRAAVGRIRRTPWLTEADRELRVQRARAAQTRGELNALTRDLGISGALPPQHGPVPPVQQAWAPPPAATPPTFVQPAQRAAMPTMPGPRKRSLRSSLVIGGLVLLVACGGGLVSCVSAIVTSVSDVTSPVSVPDNLQSEQGWTDLVADLEDGIDSRRTLEAVVRRHAATIALPDDAENVSRYYYDGDITRTSGAVRDPELVEFDLAVVEGDKVESAVAQARQRAEVSESTEAYVRVSATVEDEPTLTVTFRGVAVGYSLEINLDGSIVSEEPALS